jgi:hypothetical protein
MPEYLVRGQMIKVYDLWVEADSEEEAINAFYATQTTVIADTGALIDVELDHAEIWGVQGDEEDEDDDEQLRREVEDAERAAGWDPNP